MKYNQLSMTYKQVLILLALLVLTHSANSANSTKKLVILSVRSTPQGGSSVLYSSINGGKNLYIEVDGFSQNSKQNSVTVGTYACPFVYDDDHNSIVCKLPICKNKAHYDTYLHLTVKSNGLTATWQNVAYYSNSYTPTGHELFPSSSISGKTIASQSRHLSSDVGEKDSEDKGSVEIKLDDNVCDRNNVNQYPIGGWGLQKVNWKADEKIQAKKYNVTEFNKDYGYSDQSAIKKATLDNQTYSYCHVPAITNVTNNGSEDGHQIQIHGTSFSSDRKNNLVSVDGQNCDVKQSSYNYIKCNLPKKDWDSSAKLPTDSTQSRAYISGAGLRYTKHNYFQADIDSFIDASRSSKLGIPLQETVKTELKSPDTLGAWAVQVWKGFFKAPTTGKYTFNGAGDHSFALFISNAHGTKQLPEKPLIYSNTPIDYDHPFKDKAQKQTTRKSVELVANRSYYIEVYHLSYYYGGKFKITMEVPNNNTKLDFQAHQVEELVLNATHQPQIMTFTMINGTNGTINLRVFRMDYSTLTTSYNVSVNITYGCSWLDFYYALLRFDCHYSYSITGNSTMYDSAGKVTTNLSKSVKIEYNFSYYTMRTAACQAQKFIVTFYDYKGKFNQNQTIKHSPVIGGNFSVKIGGYNIGKIPYNIAPETFRDLIRAIPQFSMVDVQRTYDIAPEYQCRWVISFIGYLGKVPNITFNTVGLTGGAAPPAVFNRTLRNFSTNIVFNSIDERFLMTAQEIPSVLVTVNSIPAVCLTNCTYTFQKLFKIVNMSLDGSKLRIKLANLTDLANIPVLPTLGLDQIKIQAGNINCTVIANQTNITLLNISCQLPTNYDGSPKLPAGNLTFKAFLPTLGYIGLGSGVLPIYVAFAPTSLQLTSGLTNGGYSNSIIGSGFLAKNKSKQLLSSNKKKNDDDEDDEEEDDDDDEEYKKLSIMVCDKKAHIFFVSNTRINFFMPLCHTFGNYSINITYGSLHYSNLTFTYLTPTGSLPKIFMISPISSNPMIKSTLSITGTNFGTNLSAVKIYLTNSSGRVYQLKGISINDTFIKCGLPGGLPGNFTVNVNYPHANGDALANSGVDQFTYVSQIDFAFPNTGSYYGGTLLTIRGKNFSPAPSDTLVYIGYTLNWFCKIQTINETVITCLTPPISWDYTPGELLEVVVSTKLTYFSACPSNNCSFTYRNISDSPNATNITINYNSWGTVVAVAGQNLTPVYGCSFRFRSLVTGNVTDLPALNCVSSMANITLPVNLSPGSYYVSILNAYGQGNPQQLDIKWNVGDLALSTGSTQGTYNIISGGSFYPPALDKNYKIDISSSPELAQDAQILDCCTNNIVKIYFPPAPSGTRFTINFTYPLGTITMTYNVSSSITPQLNIVSPANLVINPGSTAFSINTSSSAISPSNITFESTINSLDVVVVSTWTGNSSLTNFTATLPSGSYRLRVNSSNGYFFSSAIIKVKTNSVTNYNQNISFAGANFTVIGNSLSPSSYLTVNGYKAKIIQYTSSNVTYLIPPLVTLNSQTQFNLASNDLIDASKYTIFNDQNSTSGYEGNAFDNTITSYYYSGNPQCWVGIDFGTLFAANVSRIRFYPTYYWSNAASYMLGAQFQGSNDKTNWTNISTIDSSVHTGWNIILPKTNTPFRYLRYLHNSTSQCLISEIQFFGTVYSTLIASLTSQASGLVYSDGYSSFNLTTFVYFRKDRTPVINSITPLYGDIFGGYNLTLTGTSLGFSSNVKISIDGIPCLYVSSNDTQIICLVGARPNIPAKNTFTVTLDSNTAIVNAEFLYVLKWSDDRTWGVDLPPIDNDLVVVPAGMTLLVDKSTPQLAGIAVQNGTIIFANNTNITVKTAFITLVGGRFIAGTEHQPLYSNLTFILSGGYYDPQLPISGNKMIFCLECKFSMYGKPRTAWTTLAYTINPEARVFMVNQNVDWKVGERIVVASTSFNHNQAEVRTIVSVSGRNITVDSPFKNKHLSIKQTFQIGDSVHMQAEVALLSRNIKITGDNTSKITKYGAHVMLRGQSLNGFEAKVAYSEFTLCGQPQIPGRYCIYFDMNGDAPTSYARGNVVYQSFARVIALHSSHFITIQNNVGYRAAGHNFLLQDGVETNNLFQNNLAISSLSVSNLMQSDIRVSSFMIRNPSNFFIGNRAAGSDYYGFHFDLPEFPIGSSSSKDICPQGSPLGSFTNNVAHSNIYHGLRINKLIARTYPCYSTKNQANPNDLWSGNPSIQTVLQNFLSFRNAQQGFLAENAGNFLINNFTVAQNLVAGINVYVANYTKQYIQIHNSIIVGKTVNNSINSTLYNTTSGLITPRSGSTNITNVRFHNYPDGSTALSTCSQCDSAYYFTNVGTEVFIKGLKFYSIEGKIFKFIGMKRDIVYDTDGCLAPYFNGAPEYKSTLVNAFDHITKDNPIHCLSPDNSSQWDTVTFCDNTVIIRRVMITNAIGANYWYNFYGAAMYVAPIANETILSSSINNSFVTTINSFSYLGFPRIQAYLSWSLPYVAGTKYTVWWNTGDDFSHISLTTTPLYLQSDPGIVFKFAYKTSRQLFSVGPMRGGTFPDSNSSNSLLKNSTINYLETSSCLNGDYYHNNEKSDLRMIQVCQSGKNRTVYEYTEVNAIFCKLMCPAPVVTTSTCDPNLKETVRRRWSNASQWPNNVLPNPGDNVTIPCNWTVLLDMNPEPMGAFILNGTLLVDDTFDVNITAEFIHIRSGTMMIGTNGSPFQHKLNIQLNGERNADPYFVDGIVSGNKLLVVTGVFHLHGPKPEAQTTHLSQTALKGSTTISVDSTSGWKVGDELSLSPSFSDQSQFEQVKIVSIDSSSTQVTISSPLKYTHYGASSATISHEYGSLDARTTVGHLTRNITIVGGGDPSWGFSVYVYAYNQGKSIGNAIFNGVQFKSGGQQSWLPTLQFLNLVSPQSLSQVTNSAFHNCLHSCIYVQNSDKVSITSNVFYNVAGKGVYATNSFKSLTGLTFTDNLIVGVKSSTVTAACFATSQYATLTDVKVRNNVCQGSQVYGFIFPHIKCDQLQLNPFAYNTAGSCNIGFLLNSISGSCQAFSYLSAYACSIGQIANPSDTSTLIFSNFILADNKVGAILKFGNSLQSLNNSAYFQNSYITALSRPNCTECYNATACSNLSGLRMLTVTTNGRTFDEAIDGASFDTIDAEQLLDAKAYLTNITFDGFRQSYPLTNYSASISQSCGSNFAMKTNPQAVDMTAGHYLFTSTCQNCDNNSYIYCDPNSPLYLGLNGGCGDILCTGKSNYIVMDWNGTFFGSNGSSTIIPNNTLIGDNELNCTFNPAMNGHLCNREDFVVLQYESKAPDYNSRITWPVTLTSNTTNYTTVINGWKEWNYQGSTPVGTRLGRFISVVKLYSVINMTFSSTPPFQLHFQLQKTSPNGNSSRWTMVKIYYPLPNSIEVTVGGVALPPIIMTNTDGTGLRRQVNTSKCGDNIFFFSNKTIQFVLNEDPDCQVVITLSDSVQLTTHFAMNASDFFSDTIMSSFVSNLCALLNIQDQSRVKIVGVYSGSAIIDVYIAANGSAQAAPGADPAQQSIANALAQAINDGTFSASMENVIGYQVIQASSSFAILPVFKTNSTQNISNSNSNSDSSSSSKSIITIDSADPKFIIGIIAGAVVIAFAVIIIMCYLYKKHKAAQEEIANQSPQKEEVVEDKEQSHAIVMSDQVLFGHDSYVDSPTRSPTPTKNQKRNRRVRQRQTLEVIEFD